MLCIRGELLGELPTPGADQELRREYQMQRLVERMGQGHDGLDDTVESLALEWTRGSSAADDVYATLLGRFRGALSGR
jgi:hypothetical protein